MVHNPPPPQKKKEEYIYIYIYIYSQGLQFPVFWASKRALERLTDGIQGLLATGNHLQSPPPPLLKPLPLQHISIEPIRRK